MKFAFLLSLSVHLLVVGLVIKSVNSEKLVGSKSPQQIFLGFIDIKSYDALISGPPSVVLPSELQDQYGYRNLSSRLGSESTIENTTQRFLPTKPLRLTPPEVVKDKMLVAGLGKEMSSTILETKVSFNMDHLEKNLSSKPTFSTLSREFFNSTWNYSGPINMHRRAVLKAFELPDKVGQFSLPKEPKINFFDNQNLTIIEKVQEAVEFSSLDMKRKIGFHTTKRKQVKVLSVKHKQPSVLKAQVGIKVLADIRNNNSNNVVEFPSANNNYNFDEDSLGKNSHASDYTESYSGSAVKASNNFKHDLGLWGNMIQEEIYSNLKYPYKARVRGIGGKVLIKLVITREGKLKAFKLLKSSGVPILDQEVIKATKRTKLFPVAPKTLQRKTYGFRLPIKFEI